MSPIPPKPAFEDQQAVPNQNKFWLDSEPEEVNDNYYSILTMLTQVKNKVKTTITPKTKSYATKKKNKGTISKSKGQPKRNPKSKASGKRRVARAKSTTKKVR